MRGGVEEKEEEEGEGGTDELRSGPSRSGTAAAERQRGRETFAPEVRGETAHSGRDNDGGFAAPTTNEHEQLQAPQSTR